MAAIQCQIKVPDTSSICTAPKTHPKKERATVLHRPYELPDKSCSPTVSVSSVTTNVISTLSQNDTMNLIYSNTFQKSPLFQHPKRLYSESHHRIHEEELRTLAAPKCSITSIHQVDKRLVGGGFSPPPLEKIPRRLVDSDDVFEESPKLNKSTTMFDYNWTKSGKAYDSVVRPYDCAKPDYSKYEDFAKSLEKYNAIEADNRARANSASKDLVKKAIASTIADENKQMIRSPSKARMKYTPLRENVTYLGKAPKDTNHYAEYPSTNSSPNLPKSPTVYSSRSTSEERKPYYRSSLSHETDLLRSMNLHSAAASHYDLDQSLNYEYEKLRRFSECVTDGKRIQAGAFPVIRPFFHRMYSTESGYSSDPSNNKFFKPYHPFEKSEILARRNLNSSNNHLSQSPYKERPLPNASIEKGIPVSKLHVSDEASEEALKAFDAHVEKMLAEKRMRNSPSVKLENSATPPSPNHLVQCSTVDSTQRINNEGKPELTHGVGGLLGLTRIANEHLGQALAKEKKRSKNNNCLHLWQFLRAVLEEEKDKPNRCIEWTNRERGEFRLIKTAVIADLWGQSKNRKCMTYEKMARAMRYYYKMKILEKVPHKRLHFRFGEKMLPRVLDTETLQPSRRMSAGEPVSTIRSSKGYYNSCPPPPLQMLRRSSVDGIHSPGVISFQTRLGQSDGPSTPMTPLTPLTPCTPMTPLTPCTPGVNRTPVICSRSTNIFFPPDVPLPNGKQDASPKDLNRLNSSPKSQQETVITTTNDICDLDKVSLTDSDCELVVDMD